MTTAPSSLCAVKVFDGKREILLGSRLGAGADGAVYRVAGDDTACVKIFDPTARGRLTHRLPLIRQLVLLAPALGSNAALPTRLVAENPNGPPIGFGMKRIEGSEVHNLYGVSSRQVHFPGTDFRFLVQAAKNAAIAMARLHEHKVVIGDISGRNLMVRKDATVCWIDSDSFLLGQAGFHEVCPVVTPDWTAPELQQNRHQHVPRLPGHDAFGLAVMIFYLLMLGRHPFQGRFTGSGEAPGIPQNIGNRWYAQAGYAAIPLKSPVATPPVAHLGPTIEQLFLRAFLGERPDLRPPAAEWVEALKKAEAGLRRCNRFTAHYYFSFASRCPWCELLPEYGHVDPFRGSSNFLNRSGAVSGVDPLESEIASFIAALAVPPGIPNAVYQPVAGNPSPTWNYLKPTGFIAWFTSAVSEAKAVQAAKSKFENVLNSAENDMNRNQLEQREWLRRIADAANKINQLQRDSVRGLTAANLKSEARIDLEKAVVEQDKMRYLAGCSIAAGQVAGIGEKRVSELAGHGITTAADIVGHRIMGIPGFGAAMSSSLLVWRRKMEKNFQARAVPINGIDQHARGLLVQKKAKIVQLRDTLVDELDRLIQSAKSCAGQAVAIQQKIDMAKANVLEAGQVLARLRSS
jgi:DNA-binding helix-hairpin-helix protein with protein kinase domain